MTTGSRSRRPTKDHIAETAAKLFYESGINAVGVERIADAAEVTKRTLYRHYRSKEELIAASLRHAPLIRFPETGDPLQRILGAFEAMVVFLADSRYRGCPYIFFSAELTERAHPARRLIERRLERRRDWFAQRAAEAGFRDPADVAEELDVVFDGALASGAKRGDPTAPLVAVKLARMVLERASHGALPSRVSRALPERLPALR